MSNHAHHLLKTAISLHQAGQFDAATSVCLEVLAHIPEDPDALYFLGVLSAQAKNYPTAEHYFDRAIAADPKRAEFYGNYANALLEQRKYQAAINQGLKSIALNPGHPQSQNIVGNAYLMQGDFAAAIPFFRQTVALNPSYASAHHKLGVALQRQQYFSEAINCFEQALSLQSDYPEAFQSLGQTLLESGQIDAAYQCYQKYLNLHPEDSSVKRSLMEVHPIWNEALMGQQIILRRFVESDCNYLSQCYANDDFMRFYHHYLPRKLSTEALAAKLRQNAALHPCQTKTIDWLILKIDPVGEPRPIGIANLVDIQFAHRRAELLIGIPNAEDRKSHAGLEAALLIMDFTFNRVQLHKLTSYVYGINKLAQRNTLGLGFVQEGYLREQLWQPETGQLMDIYTNGMTVNDFRSNRRLAKLAYRLLKKDIT